MHAGIPHPRLDADAAPAAAALLERCLAHLAAPDDAEAEQRLREAEAAVRRGPNLRPGEILDRRFLLVEPRPAGTLAGGWRAFDLQERREVEVRMLLPQHLVDATLRERFLAGPAAQDRLDREAAAAGQDSPVASVVRARGEWAGFAYAVYADGGTPLAARIGQLDAEERRALLVAVVEVAQRLHAAGSAHGALSTETVLVGPRGEVRLTDVGLYGGAATGLYVAPEAADPSWTATPASDVYLVGLLALALLREGPLPYWVHRDPQGVIDELPRIGDAERTAELQALLAKMLHWKAHLRPDLAEVHRVVLGGFEDQLALARRAEDQGRPAVAVARFEALVAQRPTDRQLRRSLATALASAGRIEAAAEALAQATLLAGEQDAELAADLETLRRWVAETGDPGPYVRTLETLSQEGVPGRDTAILELARFQQDTPAAWERVLAEHKTRSQAREALEHLVRLAKEARDPRRTVRFGRDLSAYADDPARLLELAHLLGRTFLDDLGDPDNGLLWLDRALAAGHPDAELPGLVRRLRTARGEWEKTVDLLEHEADRAPAAEQAALLRTAADTARWGAGDDDRAGELCARRVKLDPADDDARRHLARRAAAEGRHADAAHDLAQLRAPTADDACRGLDARIAAGALEEARALASTARERWPHHVGVLQRALAIAQRTGDDALAREVARALVDLVGPGGVGRRDALLVLADAARAAGELEAAARHCHAVLEDDPLDSDAWWGLVQVAWIAGRTSAEPAWLRAAPRRLPPQEALARMIGGLVDASAVMSWLTHAVGEVSTETSRLERAGQVVDQLLKHGLVDARLWEDLAKLAGEEHEAWVEAVRRLWHGASRSDVAFPVAAAHAWCPVEGPDHFRRTHRIPLGTVNPRPTRPPGPLLRPERRAELLVREEILVFSEEGEAPIPMEPDGRPAVVTRDGRMWRVDPTLALRLGPRGFEAAEGGGERLRFEQRCGRVYVVAEPPVTVSGRTLGETRLDEDADLLVDGAPLRFVADLPEGAFVPPSTLDVEDVEELSIEGDYSLAVDEPTIEAYGEVEPIRAALFFRLDGVDRILPLVGERVVIGPEAGADLRLGTGTGWRARIEKPALGMFQIEVQGVSGPGGPGHPKLLTQGERFTVEGVELEFQVVEARTPAPPPPRDLSPDRQPSLFLEDVPGGRTVPIVGPRFTIGRGRRNHLHLSADGKLSRHHCTIFTSFDGRIRVQDNDSSNGTAVNGEPIDERELRPGDRIEIGDTVLEFRLGPRPEVTPAPPPLDATPDGPEDLLGDTAARRRRTAGVSVTDGRARVGAANEALALVVAALDRASGPGSGLQQLQLLLDACHKRFATLFLGVEPRATGLPELLILYNLAQRPESVQRMVLSEALLDLVERAVAQAMETVAPDEVDQLLEEISRTGYRERLRR